MSLLTIYPLESIAPLPTTLDDIDFAKAKLGRMLFLDLTLSSDQTIVHYAKTLGVETVAEFIETKETALKLREIGVTYGQGYYFDKPQATVTQKEIIL